MSLDSIVERIVRELRDGPCTFRALQVRVKPGDDRKLDRALQKAKNEGMIEYAKNDGDRRKLWRLVERKPVQKVGASMATHILQVGAHHDLTPFDLYRTHDQGFADGQQHAFQVVADLIRQKAALIPHRKSAAIALKWADEIESGAWAETSDKP